MAVGGVTDGNRRMTDGVRGIGQSKGAVVSRKKKQKSTTWRAGGGVDPNRYGSK